MSEKTHFATEPKSDAQSRALVEWRAHRSLRMGVDMYTRRLVTDRAERVTCKRCEQKMLRAR